MLAGRPRLTPSLRRAGQTVFTAGFGVRPVTRPRRGRWGTTACNLECGAKTMSACCMCRVRRFTTSSGPPALLFRRRSSPSLRSSGLCPGASPGMHELLPIMHAMMDKGHIVVNAGGLNDKGEWTRPSAPSPRNGVLRCATMFAGGYSGLISSCGALQTKEICGRGRRGVGPHWQPGRPVGGVGAEVY